MTKTTVSFSSSGVTETALVVDVLDGDTFDVLFPAGGVDRVRLIGTNAPEGSDCYGLEAAEALADLILDRTIYLDSDTSDRDQYGRLLRYVWTEEGLFVNGWTVEVGYAIARDYPPDTARSNELHEAQNIAKASGVGLWASGACGEAASLDVVIADIEYDAPGDDNQNLNGEWVDIHNTDISPADLSGWVLRDESASHRFRFPAGFVLEPGETVRIFTGCGTDSSSSLYWCESGSAVWNNDGDTAFLLDPAGNIVYSFAYE